MRSLENLVRRNLVVILLVLLLGGFLMLLAELLLTGHVDGIQNVAVIASAIGAIGVAAGIFVKGTVRHVVAILLLVLTLSGLLGVRQHFESTDDASPPPLAPLSLSGLGLMGAVVLLAKQDD
jgi:hypothetical protein